MGSIVSLVIDGILKAAFSFLTDLMTKRGLIQQGREQQHSDDLQASVDEGKDAAKTQETVRTMDDIAVDDALERLRRPSTSANS